MMIPYRFIFPYFLVVGKANHSLRPSVCPHINASRNCVLLDSDSRIIEWRGTWEVHGKWTVVSGFSFSRLGLVGAVGIELLFNFTKSRVFTVLPHCRPNQLEPNGAKYHRAPRNSWWEADFPTLASYRDWIESVSATFSISGLAVRSQALHARNHFPSTPRQIERTLSPAHSSDSPGKYT